MTLFNLKYNWTELAQDLDNLNDQIISMSEELKDLNATLEKNLSASTIIRTAEQLPGVNEKVKHPVGGIEYKLLDIIMSLNDEYKWTREQIADWIETLGVDTTFKTVYTETEQEEETQ